MVGQSMVDKGTCLFGDGKGVARLGIEVHSASSTSAALGYFERFNRFTYEEPLTSIISALPR